VIRPHWRKRKLKGTKEQHPRAIGELSLIFPPVTALGAVHSGRLIERGLKAKGAKA
jgi:hypothetical protein